LDLVRTLLAIEGLQRDSIDRAWLSQIGVAEVFVSQRLTIGKVRNFAPARSAIQADTGDLSSWVGLSDGLCPMRERRLGRYARRGICIGR
jgi:hypothetical protein